jgi:PAS domain S-box-containing protein
MGFTENSQDMADYRLLAHSLASIGEMVSVTDLEDRFTYVNQAFLRIYGYTQAEVLGRHVSLVRSPNNPPGLDQEIFDHTRAGGWKGEVLNRTKDGREILIGLSTSLIHDGAGKLLGLVGIGRDITDRKRADEEIRSLARFPAENPDPVLRVARDGTILFANPASKPLLDSWGCQVGQRLPGEHRDVIPDAIELGSVKELEVLCGDRIFSIRWSPVPEGQYVNVYGRDITARKRAEEALVRRTRQLEAVRAVGTEITRELDLTGLLELIHRRAAELLGAKSGAVFLLEEATGTLIPRAWQGLGEWMGAVRLRLGEGVAGTVAERREGMLVTDYRTSPYRNPVFLERTGMTSVVAEPLLYRDRVVGVLSMDNEGMDRTFTEEDRETLALFSAQAAIAIENARLYAETVRQLEDMRALYDASRATASSLALDERLEAILIQLTRVMQVDRSMVALVDDPESDSCHLRLGYDRSKADPWLRHLDLSMLKYPEIRSAIQAQRPLIIPDVRKEPLLTSVRGALECVDLRSLLVLPLLARGRAIGAISLGYVGQGRTFTQEEIRFCQGIGDMSATAIANAQLFEQVSRAKAEWENTFDSIKDLVAIVDAEHRVVRVNRALTERLGTTPDRLMGQRCHQVLPGADKSAPGCPHADALATGETVSREIQDARLGGTYLVTCSPIRDPAGNVRGSVHVARDITEQKRLEAESRQRLRFEDISRAKSAFIATMSHELRTPLNSVIGFADLLLEQGVGPLTEKQTRYLHHIQQSGKHLLHLIGDILDLSKIEAEKFQLHCEAIPVSASLEDILVIARGLAHKKSQTIRADVSPDLPLLHADPIRFKQILFNLLSNAVKFTPESGTITVRAFQEAAGSGQRAAGNKQETAAAGSLPTAECLLRSLVIEVTDTGVGIKAEDLPRLFQEFVQLETTRDKRQEGTGLGLSLTKQLAEMHGGRIWAESEGEGKGSTFTIVLPFAGNGNVEAPGSPYPDPEPPTTETGP